MLHISSHDLSPPSNVSSQRRRAWSLTVKANLFDGTTTRCMASPDVCVSVLWRMLDVLVFSGVEIQREQQQGQPALEPLNNNSDGGGHHDAMANSDGVDGMSRNPEAGLSIGGNAVLTRLHFNPHFTSLGIRACDPILGPLTATPRYAALVRTLRALDITFNNYDESNNQNLDAFVSMATHLEELAFRCCGLTSLQALRDRCHYLTTLSVRSGRRLTSLNGLEGHQWLSEVDVSRTAIPSVEPLHTCPALKTLILNGCDRLRSLAGLDHHPLLEEINVSNTPVTSLEPLLSCPALTKAFFYNCPALTSLDGLQDHRSLEEVNASRTAITSIETLLQGCPALRTVTLRGCEQLDVAAISSFPNDVCVVGDDE